MKIFLLFSLCYISFFAYSQNTTIRGFADAGFRVSEEDNHFTLGRYDQFIQSQLSDRISFLSEVEFVYEDDWMLDVERVIVYYEVKDYFKIALGKFHTPIGYWNTAYHHGAVMQPTIERPDLFVFEHDGGILPTHTTGIAFSGSNISKLKIGYDLMIGNGTGSTPISDNNKDKAICGNINFEIIPDWRIYFSAHRDFLSRGTTAMMGDTLAVNMNQWMGNVSLVHITSNKPLEFAGEFVQIHNQLMDSIEKITNAFTVYAGYKIKNFVPFIRYDQMMYENGEPFFIKNDSHKIVAGLRYHFNYLSVLKLEYHNLDAEMMGGHEKGSNQVVLQFAVGF